MVEALFSYWTFVVYERKTIILYLISLREILLPSLDSRQNIKVFTARFLYRTSIITSTVTEPILSPNEWKSGCRLGLDSGADTSCIGKHGKIMSVVEGQVVDAHPFAKSLGTLNQLPIVHAALAYDHPHTLETFILNVNNSIYLGGESDHCLLCPNQVRENDIQVNDVPKHFEPTSSFSIYIPSIDLHLPFVAKGPTAYLPVRRPTEEELCNCDHIDLTDSETWEPYPESNSETYVALMESDCL